MWGSSLEHSICEVPAWGIPYVRFQLGAFHMLGSSLERYICEVPVWSLIYVRSTLYVYTDVRFRNHKLEMWGSELVFKQMLGFSKGYFYMLGSEVVEPNISDTIKRFYFKLVRKTDVRSFFHYNVLSMSGTHMLGHKLLVTNVRFHLRICTRC